MNKDARSAYIGYVFNSDVWGQGYATEAAGAVQMQLIPDSRFLIETCILQFGLQTPDSGI